MSYQASDSLKLILLNHNVDNGALIHGLIIAITAAFVASILTSTFQYVGNSRFNRRKDMEQSFLRLHSVRFALLGIYIEWSKSNIHACMYRLYSEIGIPDMSQQYIRETQNINSYYVKLAELHREYHEILGLIKLRFPSSSEIDRLIGVLKCFKNYSINDFKINRNMQSAAKADVEAWSVIEKDNMRQYYNAMFMKEPEQLLKVLNSYLDNKWNDYLTEIESDD
jgi:hypothetical protein